MTRKHAATFACSAVLWLLAAATVLGQSIGWPMRGGNPQNSAGSQHIGVMQGRLAWTLQTGRAGARLPAVAPDGTIHVCVTGADGTGFWGELWALRPDGSVIWTVRLRDSAGRPINSFTTPIVGPDGTIYVGWAHFYTGGSQEAATFLAFDRDGNQLWLYEPGIEDAFALHQQAILGPDGTIYNSLGTYFTAGGNEHGSLFAIDSASGKLKWRYVTPHQDSFVFPGPALGHNGKLYYVSDAFIDGARLYCLDAASGEPQWIRYLGSGPQKPLTIDEHDNLYVIDSPGNGWVTKFDADGNVLWTYNTLTQATNHSVGVYLGKVYVPAGGAGGTQGMHVLDAETGGLLAVLGEGSRAESMAIDRAGNIFFHGSVLKMRAYSAAGEPLWEAFAYAGSSISSVALGPDGLLLASAQGYLVAYKFAADPGDLNCDGALNGADIDPFFLALGDPHAYAYAYPACEASNADMNNDGLVNGADIDPFFACLAAGGCP